MKALNYPVIAITLCLAFGIFAGYRLQWPVVTVLACCAAAFILLAAAYVHSQRVLLRKPYFFWCTIILALTTGMAVQSLHYNPNRASHYTHLITNDTSVIKGTIAERLKPNTFYEKYYFRVASVNQKPATGKLLVSVPKDSLHPLLHCGDILFIAGSPQPIPHAMNPYGFDYADYMAKQNVFHQLTLDKNYIKTGREKSISYYTENLRDRFINSFASHHFSPQVMDVIKALLLGQRQDMDSQLKQDYINAGVIHILAISGLHVGILFLLFSFLLKPLRRFGKKGRLIQLLVTLLLLWFFALLSGLSPSVVRSVVMFSFISIGIYSKRETGTLNSIALSMFLLLLIKPELLFDVGFQLSYAAVTGIVVLYPVCKIRVSGYKAVNYFADIILLSIIAQAGVLPLSLYYFHQLPLLFPFANLVIIPLATGILILGLAVLALNFTLPALALPFGKLLEALILLMNGFIHRVASIETGLIKNIPFTLVLTLLLYVIITAFAIWLYKKSFRYAITALAAIVVFQAAFIVTKQQAEKGSELIVFNNRDGTIIAEKNAKGIVISCNDSIALQNRAVIDYTKENFNPELHYNPLGNLLWHNGQKILILDSLAAYDNSIRPDIIVLTQSPKVNLQRLITRLKPKAIVADGTNYKSYIKRWATTCRKAKIPFHATAEKGFYRMGQ